MRQEKLLEFGSLREFRKQNADKKIVHCHGVFDVLHAGHLAYFEAAKNHGDLLVVSLTTDKFVNKGPGKPHFNASVRASMVAALEIVDFVTLSAFPTAVPVLEELRPNFYVKGPDYKNQSTDVTGGIYAEEKAVKQGGGALVFTDTEAFSSSTLINKFFEPWSNDQKRTIDRVQQEGGLGLIEDVLDKISREEVTVCGEPIVDTYVFCTPESISSKHPCISAKFQYEENHAGGSLAIANHLSDFVKEVSLIFTHGGEPYFTQLLKEKINPRIQVSDMRIQDIPTPRKRRFISASRSERLFELTDLRSDQWFHTSPKEFCQKLKEAHRRTGVMLCADFGHGLFERDVLETVSELDGFVGLNVQTNSSNFGFNPFTKHKKFSYLTMDTNEARIAYCDKFNSPLDIAYQFRKDLENSNTTFSVSFGAHGSYYFPSAPAKPCFAPAFVDSVVDTIGAGDAFFAFTAMLVKVGCPPSVIPFLGNVFAGLKTQILGNKNSVSRASFIKATTSILK